MKRKHRRAHALVWALFVPILVTVVYVADRDRRTEAPRELELNNPSAVGVFP